jgi:hypothetical protein
MEHKSLTWLISAVSENYQDKLKVTQKVLPAIPLQLSSSVLTQISASIPPIKVRLRHFLPMP